MSELVTKTKTITVNAGDCIILPSDAVIQAVSTDGSVSFSSENCPSLAATLTSKTEVFTCYQSIFAGPVSDSGTSDSATQNWEPGNFFVLGLMINGIEYLLDEIVMGNDDDGPYDSTSQNFNFSNFLKGSSNPFHALFSATIDSAVNEDSGGADNDNRGFTVRVNFETIPSIGNNMFFIVGTNLISQFGDITTSRMYVKANAC